MKKLLILCVTALLILSCAACGEENGTEAVTGGTDVSGDTADGTAGESITPPEAPSNADALYDAGEHYRIYYTSSSDNCYMIQIYDTDSRIVWSDEIPDAPGAEDTEYNGQAVVQLTTDTDSMFINAVTGECSDKIADVIDIYGGRLIAVDEMGIYMRDMFDADVYSARVAEFSEDGIIDIYSLIGGEISEDLKGVELTYVDGEEVKTETFEVK